MKIVRNQDLWKRVLEQMVVVVMVCCCLTVVIIPGGGAAVPQYILQGESGAIRAVAHHGTYYTF